MASHMNSSPSKMRKPWKNSSNPILQNGAVVDYAALAAFISRNGRALASEIPRQAFKCKSAILQIGKAVAPIYRPSRPLGNSLPHRYEGAPLNRSYSRTDNGV